jgi:hypothetical protein
MTIVPEASIQLKNSPGKAAEGEPAIQRRTAVIERPRAYVPRWTLILTA